MGHMWKCKAAWGARRESVRRSKRGRNRSERRKAREGWTAEMQEELEEMDREFTREMEELDYGADFYRSDDDDDYVHCGCDDTCDCDICRMYGPIDEIIDYLIREAPMIPPEAPFIGARNFEVSWF